MFSVDYDGLDATRLLGRRDDTESKEPRGGYVPSVGVTAVFAALFIGTALGLLARFLKHRANTKFMIAMIVASFAYGTGLAIRLASRHSTGLGLYIIQFSLIALSPCGTIASLYAMLARFAISLDAPHKLLLPARRVTLIFVLSDVVTFLIQSTGGTLSIPSGDPPNVDRAKLGQQLFKTGIILQFVSFVFFIIIALIFLIRVSRVPAMWRRDNTRGMFADWRYVAGALLVACVCVVVRSVYRTIEALSTGGVDSKLAHSQTAFFVLDGFPIWLSMTIFVPFWPGKVLMAPAAPYSLESGTADASKYTSVSVIPLDESRRYPPRR